MLDPRKSGWFCNDHIFVWKLLKRTGELLGIYSYCMSTISKAQLQFSAFDRPGKYFFHLQSTKRTSLVTYVFVKETFFPTLYHCCWIRFTEIFLRWVSEKKKFNEAGIIANCNRVHTKNCNHNYFKHFSRTFQGPSRFSKTIFYGILFHGPQKCTFLVYSIKAWTVCFTNFYTFFLLVDWTKIDS